MRLLVDANIIFSALYDMESSAGRLLMLAAGEEITLFSTGHIKDELKRILVKKLGYSRGEIGGLIVALPVEWIDREIYADCLEQAKTVLHDESDASLLACASVLGVDVVSGDRLVLAARFHNVKVRRLKEFRNHQDI